ncbi:AAA family ATPase [Sulfoacidibacillus thermotolerans]|uniref:AAA domain-containing protein n=1 Tax=Sulfoacidibacillus thermotolerans TaxID=1765684 RepID=A0A2U3DCR6_SULT2|nr:AAA family ATPase [Sulfoacidibacillus thermotolerans]PWI59083.1 hypothetical protein BM613_00295 [Sulfoacidibacillus thermotolerans]
MTNVWIVATSPLRETLTQLIEKIPGVVLMSAVENIREVLGICTGDHADGILVLEDRLLNENSGLLDRTAKTNCSIFLYVREASIEATRRALSIHAVDLVTLETISKKLFALMQGQGVVVDKETTNAVISVYSPKGGVGKSTLAVNLAWSLAQQSQKQSVLIDLDLQFGDIGPMIASRPDLTIQELVEWNSHTEIQEEQLLRTLTPVTEVPLDLLLAPLQPQYASMIKPHHIREILDLLRKSHKYTICDLSSGLTDQNLTAMEVSDVLLLVVSPEIITLRTVKRSLKILQTLYPVSPEIRIVLNRAGSGMNQMQIEDFLHLPITYFVPSGGATIARLANIGKPLMVEQPRHPVAKALSEIASDLSKKFEGTHLRVPKS